MASPVSGSHRNHAFRPGLELPHRLRHAYNLERGLRLERSLRGGGSLQRISSSDICPVFCASVDSSALRLRLESADLIPRTRLVLERFSVGMVLRPVLPLDQVLQLPILAPLVRDSSTSHSSS